MADFKEKFLVINWKYLQVDTKVFSREENQAISDFRDALEKLKELTLLPPHKYYVCNQDEPYAETVISTILKGEDAKVNPVELRVSQSTCETLQKRFDIYAKAINDIDDFFEYRYKNLSNEQIKEIVMNFIDTITLKLSKLSG